MGYDRMGNGVDVAEVPKDIELDNNSMGDGARNQDNRRATIEDVEDSDDVIVDLIDGVLIDILANSFGPLSLHLTRCSV